MSSPLRALQNLEESFPQDFVIETRRIEIPGYPHAFNPSIIRWKGFLLMSFRIVPDPKFSFLSWIGLLQLDDQFQPLGKPILLNLRNQSLIPSRAEDARLVVVGQSLYMVYSDNAERTIHKKGFRVYVAELIYKDGSIVVKQPECVSSFEGESEFKREKNWVPFDHQGELLLAYSLTPHRIFKYMKGKGKCETLFETESSVSWEWGELRGGTPALLQENDYLAFFHSSKEMVSIHSKGKKIRHYFVGAYTFSSKPPFELKQISSFPIVNKGFYQGEYYQPFWKPARIIFPGGILVEDQEIWIAYGREDHEIWIAKIDKDKLLKSLIPIHSL